MCTQLDERENKKSKVEFVRNSMIKADFSLITKNLSVSLFSLGFSEVFSDSLVIDTSSLS